MSVNGTSEGWALNGIQKNMLNSNMLSNSNIPVNAEMFSQVLAQENLNNSKTKDIINQISDNNKNDKPNALPDGSAPNALNTPQEMTRASVLAQAQKDKLRTQALANLEQAIGTDSSISLGGSGASELSGSLLSSARDSVHMLSMRSVIGDFRSQEAIMPMSNSIKSQALQQFHRQLSMGGKSKDNNNQLNLQSNGNFHLGKLSAQFESGGAGIEAIGYDRVGGTSYGKYQIASRVGSMDNFLNFLDKEAPDLSKKLRDAGSSNTGGRTGDMPDVWTEIAKNEPDRFEALQDRFIYNSHYKPALNALSENVIKEGGLSKAMQEVLWSTAVQHGPTGATRIFNRAAENVAENTTDTKNNNFEAKMIDNIYSIRAEQFGSSTESVQKSVRNRMNTEKQLALNLLSSNTNEFA